MFVYNVVMLLLAIIGQSLLVKVFMLAAMVFLLAFRFMTTTLPSPISDQGSTPTSLSWAPTDITKGVVNYHTTCILSFFE